MDLDPLHGFFFIPIRREFLYLRGIGFIDRMTTDAFLDARNSGDPRPLGVYVAVKTGDAVVPGVDSVGEFNGLARGFA